MATTSRRNISERSGSAEDLQAWSPEGFAYQMLEGTTKRSNRRSSTGGAKAWKTQVFEDVDDSMVRGTEWPHPPGYRYLPIFWNHDAHGAHVVANAALCFYFFMLAVLRPLFLLVPLRIIGIPDAASAFIFAGISLRFLLMSLQLRFSRRFAIHSHTKEMLARMCGEQDEDRTRIEDEFFNSACWSFAFTTTVLVVASYVILGSDELVVMYFCVYAPVTYLHAEERLCSMGHRLAALYSRCLVEDFHQYLLRDSSPRRDLSLWDLLKGVTPEEIGMEVVDDTADGCFPYFAEQMQEGFWTGLIRQHQDLTRQLIYVWIRAEIPFVLLLAQAMLFIMGLLFMAFLSKIFLFQLACACIAAMHALIVFVMDLLPCAQVTDMCVSTTVGFRSIRTLSNRHFGQDGVSPAMRREHANYMRYIAGTPCGVHLPFLGGVSMAEILGRVKIIAALLPVVVAHFAIADSNRSDAAADARRAASLNGTLNASLNASWAVGF